MSEVTCCLQQRLLTLLCVLFCFNPADDQESEKCHLGAVIVRDLSIVVSNYRSVMTLDEYCKKHNVLGISGIDTRQLTKVIDWSW